MNQAGMRIILESMKRVTISVPDQVLARAQASGNASRWFSTAGMRFMGAEHYLAAGMQHMAGDGVTVADDGVRAAGAVLHAAEQRMSPEAWAALRRGPAAYRAFLASQGAAAADAA